MSYSGWAVVELMGHKRHVGRVCEVQQYGVTMMQLDAVVRGEAALATQYVAGSAIYRVTPCSEEQARADWSVAEYNVAQLPQGRGADFGDEDREVCGAEFVDDLLWRCAEKPGHSDEHVARDDDGEVLRRWPQESTTGDLP